MRKCLQPKLSGEREDTDEHTIWSPACVCVCVHTCKKKEDRKEINKILTMILIVELWIIFIF